MTRVRFAPSPTGYLHLGNMRTALFNYLFAQHEGGQFILRIEDTDKERSRKEFVDHIYEDLSWLGIQWDEGPDKDGPYGPYLQSERFDLYKRYAEKFIAEGNAYYCYCTEAELEEKKQEQLKAGKTPQYDNRCRNLSPQDRQRFEAEGRKPNIRFKVKDTKVVVKDIIRGDVTFDVSLIGDFVIMRPDGSPTFHLAVCIDDGLMKITHVVRGEDHLSNTPRHVLIFKACGFEVPQFAHMPLTMGPGGEPLSKRLGAMSIAEYRKKGYPSEALVNYMALLGWSNGDDREIFTLEELKKLFLLKRVSHSAAIFDKDKLDWVCGEHVRTMSDNEFVQRSIQYLLEEEIINRPVYLTRPEWYQKVVLIFKENVACFSDLADRLAIFNDEIEYTMVEGLQTNSARLLLRELEKIILSLEKLDEEDFDGVFKELKKLTKCKGKELFMPVRIALTGREHGPELKKIVALLGKSACLKRIEKAIEIANTEKPQA
jgi:nondiscriminating glutamyl-tRNA synthetase